MKQASRNSEQRTKEQIREHYEIEKELASRLRDASKQERRSLYSTLYDELYLRVSHHPQLTRSKSPRELGRAVFYKMKFLKRFLTKDSVFIEVGPGDCCLSYEIAKHVKYVYAVDVSEEITKALTTPTNFQLILSDGCSIPVPHNSVHVAYSNQLMEHLHPDDAFEQLQNIYNALTISGIYICITPNGLTGPHDVSKSFDEIPTGFHLKEYTIHELDRLFRNVGFSKVRAYVGTKGIIIRFPIILLTSLEWLLFKLPYNARKAIVYRLSFRILNARLVGIK